MKQKVVILGDTHGRSVWKYVVQTENPDVIIFLGDYFDTREDIWPVEQVYNFQQIMEYKKTSGKEVVCLIGNHDFHYFPEIGNNGTSGYQAGAAPAISKVIDDNREHLQVAYKHGDFLFTHAGVSCEWMDNNFDTWDVVSMVDLLNDKFKYQPRKFGFTGIDPYGDDTYQSPIWIRPKSLMKVNKKTLRDKVIQVVGHTSMEQIDTEGKSTGKRYYFIDTLGTSGEYMIIEDKDIYFNTWKSKAA